MGLFGVKGLGFSLKRAVGVSAVKQKVAKATKIPTTKMGVERKIGGSVLKSVGLKSKK